jgi:hypothetical protein
MIFASSCLWTIISRCWLRLCSTPSPARSTMLSCRFQWVGWGVRTTYRCRSRSNWFLPNFLALARREPGYRVPSCAMCRLTGTSAKLSRPSDNALPNERTPHPWNWKRRALSSPGALPLGAVEFSSDNLSKLQRKEAAAQPTVINPLFRLYRRQPTSRSDRGTLTLCHEQTWCDFRAVGVYCGATRPQKEERRTHDC